MALEWGSPEVEPAEPVKPTAARGQAPYASALRSALQWTALASHAGAQRMAAGAGSSNFTLRIPIAHYPGRGALPLELDLVYNSRVWQRVEGPGFPAQMTFNIDNDWPAPGWSLHFGKLVRLGQFEAMIVEPDGTRRPYRVDSRTTSGAEVTVTAHTIDGSGIIYTTVFAGTSSMLRRGVLARSDGTSVTFTAGNEQTLYATRVTDASGNSITIDYADKAPAIQSITDTCGRKISFGYREMWSGELKLSKVTGPPSNSDWSAPPPADIELALFTFSHIPLTTSFGISVHEPQAYAETLRALEYPETETGYWIPAENYSSYGVLRRVEFHHGMSNGDDPNHGIQIHPGQAHWSRVYNYPDAGPVLTDSPWYRTLTETWTGQEGGPTVTQFAVARTAAATTTTITWPDATTTVEEVTPPPPTPPPPDALPAGLLKTLTVKAADGRQLQHTTAAWILRPDKSPFLTETRVLDEANHLSKTTFTPSDTPATEPTAVHQLEYGAAPGVGGVGYERVVRTVFVDDPRYLGRNLRNLPETVQVVGPDGVVTRTEYAYDRLAVTATPGAPGRDPRFERGSGSYEEGTRVRGNLTTVTRYADARTPAEPVEEFRFYDNCGNVNMTRVGRGQLEHLFTADTQYSAATTILIRGEDPAAPRCVLGTVHYYRDGQPASATDANGRQVAFRYDDSRRLSKVTLTNTGAEATIRYDEAGLTTTVTTRIPGASDPVLATTTTTDGLGRTVAVREAHEEGISGTFYRYDARGRLTGTSEPVYDGQQPHWTTTEYDALGRSMRSVGPDGGVTAWHYNEANRPQNRTHPGTGNPTVRVVDPAGTERWMSFDALGRVEEIAHPAAQGPGTVLPTCGGTTRYGYDAAGNTIEVTLSAPGGDDQQRRFRYDGLGRLVRQYLPEAGDGIQEVRAGSVDTWSVALAYDERSNLIRRQDGRGLATVYDYGTDPLDRLQRVTYDTSGYKTPQTLYTSCPDVTYTYMPDGDVRRVHTETTAGVCTRAFTYDPVAGLASTTTTMQLAPSHPFTVDYGYDALGRRTSVTYPDRYDPAAGTRAVTTTRLALGGRPYAVLTSDFAEIVNDMQHTAAGLPTSITLPYDTETYLYEHADPRLLTEQSVTLRGQAGTQLLHLQHEYGPATLAESGIAHPVKTSVDLLDGSGTRTTTYDRLGQIDVASGGAPPGPGSWTETYGFDGRGNRTAVTAAGELAAGTPAPPDGLTGLTYNNENRVNLGHGFLYDMSGNLIRSQAGPGVEAYVYDAAGRLSWADTAAASAGFVYGGGNQLLATVRPKKGYLARVGSPASTDPTQIAGVTYHVWDGDQIVADYTATGPDLGGTLHWSEESYYLGTRLLSTLTRLDGGGEQRRFHHPGLTGTRLVTGPDPTGGTAHLHADHDPLPFGSSLWRDGGAARTFTSYLRDVTGIDYAVNRFYHPRLGRFLQPDPLGQAAFEPSSPVSLNLYAYCDNNPVNRTDQLGLMLESIVRGTRTPEWLAEWNRATEGPRVSSQSSNHGGGGGGGRSPSGDQRISVARADANSRLEGGIALSGIGLAAIGVAAGLIVAAPVAIPAVVVGSFLGFVGGLATSFGTVMWVEAL